MLAQEFEEALQNALIDLERAKFLMMPALTNTAAGVNDGLKEKFRAQHYDLAQAAGWLHFASERLMKAARYAGKVAGVAE